MKKRTLVLSIILALAMMLPLAACNDASAGGAAEKMKVGVIQLVEHDALDASYNGFIAALATAGYSEADGTLELVYQNAQGEQSNCVTIADQLASEGCDLILAIATPAAQAVANKIKNVPILVTAVTDPFDAGIVESNELPNTNVSGTSDLNPIDDQMDLLLQLVPDVKTVALFYCSSEDNSKFQVDLAAEKLNELGIASIEFTVTAQTEIQQVVESMAGKVDAIYIPTDNMLASGMATVAAAANKIQLPVIVGEGGMVENGGLATYGIDYYKLGEQTGEMAVKILKDGADVSKMPIEYQSAEDLAISVNTDTASAIGYVIPDDVLSKATVYPK